LTFEILILVVLTFFTLALPIIRIVYTSDFEPIMLKAYVFSKIMESRYHGGKIEIDQDGVKYWGKERVEKKFSTTFVDSANYRPITYRMGSIRVSGTVYFKSGSVSFHPVTGLMVVRGR
jgi:hypothetical protein